MPRREPLHPEFARALLPFAREGTPYAEAWRALIPVAARIGRPRPSYTTVLRFLRVERARAARRQVVVDRVVARVLAGRPLLPSDVNYLATEARRRQPKP